MKVKLLDHTDDPLLAAYSRTRGTTTADGFDTVWEHPRNYFPKKVRENLHKLTESIKESNNLDEQINILDLHDKIEYDEKLRLVKDALRSGHWSVSRGITFTFSINCSRSESLQLIRHKISSEFEQSSQRYCNFLEKGYISRLFLAFKNFEFHDESEIKKNLVEILDESFVIPENVLKNDELLLGWTKLRLEELKQYELETKSGVPLEDARANLPNCARTTLIVTMSFEALKNFLAVRLCTRAEHPIRETAKEMRKLVLGVVPWAGEFLTIKCIPTGLCSEKHYKDCPLIFSNGGNILPEEQAKEVLKNYVNSNKRKTSTQV